MEGRVFTVIDTVNEGYYTGVINRYFDNIEWFTLMDLKTKGDFLHSKTNQTIKSTTISGLIDNLKADGLILIDLETRQVM